jgi:hypothetical protein
LLEAATRVEMKRGRRRERRATAATTRSLREETVTKDKWAETDLHCGVILLHGA